MTTLILLTSSQADAVRGPSTTMEGAALEPIALTDGRFVLPVAVLDDPAHAAHRDFLAALPRATYADIAALVPQPSEA